QRRCRMAGDRARLRRRSAGRAWRPARQEFDQRGLYPQHVRRLAWIHGYGRRRVERTFTRHRAGAGGAAAMTLPQRTSAPVPLSGAHADAPSVAECEQFLVYEARLLDEGRFDEWLELFAADAWYWVPSEPNQANPRDIVSLIYDDRRLLETRVRRLASPRIHSQEPPSPTSPHHANVTTQPAGGKGLHG